MTAQEACRRTFALVPVPRVRTSRTIQSDHIGVCSKTAHTERPSLTELVGAGLNNEREVGRVSDRSGKEGRAFASTASDPVRGSTRRCSPTRATVRRGELPSCFLRRRPSPASSPRRSRWLGRRSTSSPQVSAIRRLMLATSTLPCSPANLPVVVATSWKDGIVASAIAPVNTRAVPPGALREEPQRLVAEGFDRGRHLEPHPNHDPDRLAPTAIAELDLGDLEVAVRPVRS